MVNINTKQNFRIRDYTSMTYRVCDIFKSMGRHWHADDEFYYPLDLKMRYSDRTVSIMSTELSYRIRQADVLIEDCRAKNIPIPKRLAINMPTDTSQQLQMALHRFREEVNRMSMRRQRFDFRQAASERAEEGLMAEAQIYWNASMDDAYKSDIDLTDED